jgi:hypothetical protein
MKTKILLLTSLALTSNLAWAAAEVGALARSATRVASRAALVSLARPVLLLATRPFAVEVFPVSPFPVRAFSTRIEPTAETSLVEASPEPALSDSKKPKKEYITIPPELYDYENLDRGAMRIAEYVRKNGLEEEFKEKVLNNCVGEGFEERFGENVSRFNFLKTWIKDIREKERMHEGDLSFREYLSRQADTVRGVLNNKLIALSRVARDGSGLSRDELRDLENVKTLFELYIR